MAITYTPTTNFGAKDSLPTNDPDKVIKGSEFTTEFTALQTAFSLAAPNASPTFTGTVTIPTADINGGAIDGTTIGGTTPAAATFTSLTATTADINGGAIDGTVIGGATPAAASFTTVSATGNITVGGTVDGRDVAADGTKLDGIEAGADVTDTTNVTAAGALMDSELTNIAAVKALNQGVATTDSPSFAGLTATGSVSLAGASTTADITFGDNDKAIFGAGSDLQIYHDGSTSIIKDAGTGELQLHAENNLRLQNLTGSTYAKFTNGAQAELYYGGNLKLATTATGIDVTGDVSIGDGSASGTRLLMGAGGDSKMFHNGVDTYWINDTGNIVIRNESDDKDILLQTDDGSGGTTTYITVDGSETDVSLHYGGSVKLATTATGIDVTGTVTADGLTVSTATDALITIADATLPSIQKLELKHNAGASSFTSGNNGVYGSVEFKAYNGTTTINRLGIASNGDISFYEDTGTTPKFFWDASAEALGIGTSSPTDTLSVGTLGAGSNTVITIGASTTGTSSLYFGDGTGAARFRGYFDYVHSSDTLVIGTAASERMRIDSSGNVGIGTTASGFNGQGLPLVVGSGSGNTGMTIYSGAAGYGTIQFADTVTTGAGSYAGVVSYNHTSDFMYFSTAATERMRIDSSGNVCVTSSGGLVENGVGVFMLPAGELRVKDNTEDGTSQLSIYNNNTTNDSEQFFVAMNGGSVEMGNRRSGDLRFKTNDIERARIDSSGNLLVGTAAVNSTVDANTVQAVISGNSQLYVTHVTGTASGIYYHAFSYGGSVIGSITQNGTTGVLYNTSSDARLKENIADAEDASSLVDAIKVRQFDWKADGSHQRYGMVAQELLEVAPEAVSKGATEDDMMGVDYSKLVPMLVKEIQSLRARVAQLEGV